MPTLEHGQNVDLQEVTSISCKAKVHATLAVQVQANKHFNSFTTSSEERHQEGIRYASSGYGHVIGK
jgi:hypothetical protein